MARLHDNTKEEMGSMPGVADSILKREVTANNDPRSSATGTWFHAAVFVGSVLLVISHRPDAVTNPQFWAEDGRLWYAEAHNLGWWKVLFHPVVGYFCTVPRLTAALAQLLPLAAAPLLFNLAAIFFQVLPVSFFLSSRFNSLATLPTRLLFGFLYLALPNSFEVSANITNVQWHLALLLCLVVMAEPTTSLWWRCFDVTVIVLASLTGPFAILLLPLAGAVWGWKRREKWTLVLLSILTAGALLQVGALLHTGNAARGQGDLGATPMLFAWILTTRVFLAALVGGDNLPYGDSYALNAVLFTVAGIAAFVYGLWRARWELKVFVVFASVVLTAALLTPIAPPPKWLGLLTPLCTRYWLLPMLAFVAALVWMAGAERPKGVRLVAIAALALMSVGIVRDWRYPPFVNLHFGVYARRYSDLPKGSALTIPLNPPGWTMTLTKR
jgi:hypothetical protein